MLGALPAATLADLEARDDRLRALLGSFDGFASKAMRIRLEYLAVDHPALTAQFRTLLSTTITSYVDGGGLDRLRQRVAGSAARQDPGRADALAEVVADAAERVLGLRGALGDAVLGLAVELANGALPMIHERCRERGLPDDVRRQWTALRSDFEQLGDHPLRLAERRFADRQRALLTPDLMLDEIPEPLLSDLIEPY